MPSDKAFQPFFDRASYRLRVYSSNYKTLDILQQEYFSYLNRLVSLGVAQIKVKNVRR